MRIILTIAACAALALPAAAQTQSLGAMIRDPVPAPAECAKNALGYSNQTPLIFTEAMHINCAKTSIDMAAYALTSDALIAVLVKAETRGVAVRVIIDSNQQRSPHLRHLRDVRVAPPGLTMHLKAYLADDWLLRTGSANFSASALMNDSQVNDISYGIMGAKIYRETFKRLWAVSTPLASAPPAPLPAPRQSNPMIRTEVTL